MREKRLRQEADARANKSYMHRWMERAEEDNQKRAADEQAKKKKVMEN